MPVNRLRRISPTTSDGWIVLGGTLDVDSGPPWTPGETVDVSATLENFTGANFCTERAILANSLEKGTFDVCAAQGGTKDVTQSIDIPDFPDQQFSYVTISIEGSDEGVTGEIDTGDDGGNGGGGGGGGQAAIVINDCSLTPEPGSTLDPNDVVEVQFSLRNDGDAAGVVDCEITAGGTTIDTFQQDANAGATRDFITTFVPVNYGLTGSFTVDVTISGADAA
jgi:hypothetical protein